MSGDSLKKLHRSYEHIFFDLDHTLWDFEKNSFLTIEELYENFKLHQHTTLDVSSFYEVYTKHNNHYWDLFRRNQINRQTLRYIRFHKTIEELGIDNDAWPHQMSEFYLSRLPLKEHLIKDAREVLEYLSAKYKLNIITNGFDEVQHKKLEVSGIKPFFSHIITSEVAGYQKPHTLIFKYALEISGAGLLNSIVIGDSIEADIIGAQNAGLDHIFFNPLQTETHHPVMYQIAELRELYDLL
jgi:putative hydrolase of the HAD superfamily